MIKVIYNPRCSKCRNLGVLLDENHIDWQPLHYLTYGIDESTLREILDKSGLQCKAILRSKDPAWQAFDIDPEQADEATLIAFIVNHPQVLERPIVITENQAIVARPPEKALTILKNQP